MQRLQSVARERDRPPQEDEQRRRREPPPDADAEGPDDDGRPHVDIRA